MDFRMKKFMYKKKLKLLKKVRKVLKSKFLLDLWNQVPSENQFELNEKLFNTKFQSWRKKKSNFLGNFSLHFRLFLIETFSNIS